MLILSSLLGSVKPPAASGEDVAAAPGIFRLSLANKGLVAKPKDAESCSIKILSCERCQICLEEYRAEEDVRQLVNCLHVFHRECIDEVFVIVLPVCTDALIR